MTMNKKSNEHFINTFADGNYEVATPPFFKDKDNKRLVFDALDVGIHENIFTEGELDAAHGVMIGTATLENDGITAVARALQRHSELFPVTRLNCWQISGFTCEGTATSFSPAADRFACPWALYAGRRGFYANRSTYCRAHKHGFQPLDKGQP